MKPNKMDGLIATVENRIKYNIGELEGMCVSLHNDMGGVLRDIRKKKVKRLTISMWRGARSRITNRFVLYEDRPITETPQRTQGM